MNFNTQPRSDEMIDRELEAMRQPVESKYGLGDAIRTMQSRPVVKRNRFKWPLGVGSVAVIGGTIVLIGSLTPSRALAGELHAISLAQEHQATKYMKAVIFGGSTTPMMIHETWTDHEKEAYRQYDPKGIVQAAIVGDGERSHTYFGGGLALGRKYQAFVDEDRSDHFSIETIDALLNSKFFREHKIEKKSGVVLNGKTCDFYNFANGYYRVWVDPATKLPLQREIYDRGVTLWERDVYEYPTLFPATTFLPYRANELEYFDYIGARDRLRATLKESGRSQKVGNVTITLKAVIQDDGQVRAIWSTSGVDGSKGGASPSFEIPGAEKMGGYNGALPTEGVAPGQALLNEGVLYRQSLPSSATIRIAAWEPSGGSRDPKFVGWATFKVTDVLRVPAAGGLLRQASQEIEKAASGVATATGKG
jgi:hypothetical protein